MHSYDAKNGTTFHYNSDFSGEVIIQTSGISPGGLKVNAEDILAFVAYNYVMPGRISKIEQANWKEILSV